MLAGTISVLYKKKDRDDPRNYRPLTLLNCDYKIMMRILAVRMNEAVVQFVSEDQNGFVPDAFIAENLIRLQLLQDLIESTDQNAVFLFIDMEKAFDRCDWDYLNKAIDRLKFTESHKSWFNLLYNESAPPTRKAYV